MNGVIDAAGATIGSQLKAAYTTGKATCSNFEGAVCWEEGVPDISYLVGGPEGCGSDANIPGEQKEINTALIADCATIDAIVLSKTGQ